MLNFFFSITKLFLSIFRSKKSLTCEIALLKKEIEILKRKNAGKKVVTNHFDRLFIVGLNKILSIKDYISIVKPETVLRWQRDIIRKLWTFKTLYKKRGRKSVDRDIQNLILEIKNENILWGAKRIQGELMKLNIFLDTKTIGEIIKKFRRNGKIIKSLHWRKFLKMQINSLYAMDMFTIDTIFNKRFYVFFIISHKTREIIRFAVTENPVKEFVRQQLIKFEQEIKRIVYMIHDNASQFYFDYLSYGIKEVRTSIQAPNMNAIAERFVGSVRREALDHFLIINRNQVKNILTEYFTYYNTKRPHQGIGQDTPKKYIPFRRGEILKVPVLSGLHHHYYRKAA